MRRTKIIVTIGPATHNYEIIKTMISEGADAIRLNFSHGAHEEKKEIIKMVRDIEEELNKPIPIIGDLQGPVVRLGSFKPIELKKRMRCKLVKGDESDSSKYEFAVPSKEIFSVVEVGDLILVAGGLMKLTVEEVESDQITCITLIDGTMEPHKTLIVKGKEIPLHPITEKDNIDMKFCIDNDVDYLMLSFIRRREHVVLFKDILRRFNARIRVIPKIETRSAVDNLEGILEVSDGILVARGDLGMYFPLEEIPNIQTLIVEKCLRSGVPVMVATQLLESMIDNPLPTRSEVVDVMTAVKCGVDGLLLSGETAIGKYPIEAVKWLRRIIESAEKTASYSVEMKAENIYDRFARGAGLLAESLGAKILAFTRSGSTALRLSRNRLRIPIYVVTNTIKMARFISILWGIRSFYVESKDMEECIKIAMERLKSTGELSYGDIVVCIRGLRRGATDAVNIEIIQ